jgi:hypothetical protein
MFVLFLATQVCSMMMVAMMMDLPVSIYTPELVRAG